MDDGYLFPSEFRGRTCAINFPGTEENNPTLVDPSDGSLHEVTATGIIGSMRGKRCLACTGDNNWFLVLDEATRECFLTTLFVTAPSPPAQEPEPAETSPTAVVRLPPMPTDPPHLELLYNCALSAPTPTSPGCLVLLGLTAETYLRYCRPGDEAWSQVQIMVDHDIFDGTVAFHRGKIYATTYANQTVVVDASSSPVLRVERFDDVTIPGPFPGNLPRLHYLIPTTSPDGGDLYFVRANLFGYPGEVVGVEVCRWDPSKELWREVDSIGDTTFFVGNNCVAVSPATEAGTEPNCIHILSSSNDGVRVYTFSLHDRTIRYDFVRMGQGQEEEQEEEEDDEEDTNPPPFTSAYWSVASNCCRFQLGPPSRQGNIVKPSRQGNINVTGDEQQSLAWALAGQMSECAPPCSNVTTDLLAVYVVPKLSFVDFLHLKLVCKEWSDISAPIRCAMAWPLLMTPNNGQPTSKEEAGGSFDVFDPVTKNRYTLSVQVPSVTVQDDDSALLTLHCSRNGWVLVSRGLCSLFLVNPFKRGDKAVVVLPQARDVFSFKGVSFCSAPGSPDFTVMIIEGDETNNTVSVRTWREGEESWELHEDILCEVPFSVATHNPLFLDGEFFCMARDGKIGAFNPKTAAWRILAGVQQIITYSCTGDEVLYEHLVEWKGEVVTVMRDTDVEEPIEMFQLDRTKMVWSKIEELEDGAVFWDRKQAIARHSLSLPRGVSCNKVYVPTFTESDDGVRECVFYSLETKEYSNGSWNLLSLKEPLNALWFEPNLDDYE